MSDLDGFVCGTCGKWHKGLPLDYAYGAPDFWSKDMQTHPNCFINDDFCVVRQEHFFVRSLIEIPIFGRDEPFRWGVWGSLSRQNFDRVVDLWNDPKLLDEPAYFSWLSNSIEGYPSTLNLKTNMRSRTVKDRPFLELEETDHPLAVEQRSGISVERLREIASQAIHKRRY